MATVVILGASSGIGAILAQICVAKGDTVHALARSQDKLDALSDSPNFHAHAFDARDEDALRAKLQEIGEIDHLVLTMNAGSATGEFKTLEMSAIRNAFENKVFPYMVAILAAADQVKGSITLVTGAAASAAFKNIGTLAATNSALNALVGVLALELAPVRVNGVSPGVTETPYWDGVPDDFRDEFFQSVGETTPVGRIGTAKEIAEAVLFVMEHGFTTGAILDVDGGAHLK